MVEISNALPDPETNDARRVFGGTDAMKLKSADKMIKLYNCWGCELWCRRHQLFRLSVTSPAQGIAQNLTGLFTSIRQPLNKYMFVSKGFLKTMPDSYT